MTVTPGAAPLADPALLHFAMAADRLTEAALRGDIVQALVSSDELSRIARSLGPEGHETAMRARTIVEKAAELLETALARGMATRRDPRHAAYVTAGAA